MKYLFSLSLLLVVFFSCRRSDDTEVAAKKDTEALYQRFHGKYKIVSSVADEALDLNFDGRSSVNLKDELIDIENSKLILRIRSLSDSYYFDEFWQEPDFGSRGAPATYDPFLYFLYANKGIGRTFEFAPDLKSIKLLPDYPNTDTLIYTRPSSILIRDGDLIEITKTKRFYTFSGWKYVRVVTLYKRYTITT